MKHGSLKKLFPFYPYLIAALVFLLCLSVWPARLFGHTVYESTSLERGIFPNLNLSDNSIVTGSFRPAHSRLDSLSFQFLTSGKAKDGTVTLELYDDTHQKLCSVTLESGDIMNYRWVDFPVALRLDEEKLYSWQLRAYDYEEASLALYTGSPLIGPDETLDTAFYYNGAPHDTLTAAIRFTYTDRLDRAHRLPYYTVFVLLGALLYAACRRFEKTHEEI